MRRQLPLFIGLFYFLTVPAAAQQPGSESGGEPPPTLVGEASAPTPAQIDELNRRIDVLAAELERLRSGEPDERPIGDDTRRGLGLAPSAAEVYRRPAQGVSFAGYGEMLLENFKNTNESGAPGAPTTRLDFLRAILYTGYRFNDKFVFNSELEVEHGSEIFVEFAYVDYLASEHLTLRGGLVLLPLGFVNEFHEPNVFIGAKRPETEQRILPSTWRENGAGILGSFGRLNYRAYVTNGFNGAGYTSAGLRGGRQKGVEARAANLAFSSRVDFTPTPGVTGGIGLYRGGAGQEQVLLDDDRLDLDTTIVEVHGQAQMRGVDLRALFARASLSQAGEASRALQRPVGAPLAEEMQGGYIQVGYNVLSQVNTPLALTPYGRYEVVDTQHRVPAGFTRDLSRDGTLKTLGIELKPISNVVIKTDYQWITNQAKTGRNQFNLNLGYAF
jgi:hypothetical protein